MNLLPTVPSASPTPPTEQEGRLERLIRAGEAFYVARDRYHDYDGDDSLEEEQLCDACSKARIAFAQACERFILNLRYPL